MAIIVGAGHSINLDSFGCFRSEIARVCNERSCHSLRRWHGDQVKAGRLQENRDFVVVRDAPNVKHQNDDVFYFRAAIELCRLRRPGKPLDIGLLPLKPLRDYGFTIVDGQVVKRLQLSLLNLATESLVDRLEEISVLPDEAEANNSDIISTTIARRFNGVSIRQRSTDGYIHAEHLCRSVGLQWKEFQAQFKNPNTEMGAYLKLQSLVMGLQTSCLIQTLQVNESGLRGTWLHPDIARWLAERLSPELAYEVEGWKLDVEAGESQQHKSIPAEVENAITKIVANEVKKLGHTLERKLLTMFLQEREAIKRNRVFAQWDQTIRQAAGDTIRQPLYSWKVLKRRPTTATKTTYPFIYIIIIDPPHELQGYPEIFYVGISSQTPSDRFSNHDGLKSVEALEKHGYKHTIYYYESFRFAVRTDLKILEITLQAALKPYWEHLSPEQRSLMKQGKLITTGLFPRLYTREELAEAS